MGSSWSNTCQSEPGAAPRCSLPHLLGFCKLLSWERLLNPSPASAATAMPVSYSYGFAYGPFAGWACLNLLQSSGAVADLVLWALLRLQYKLFRSDVYSKVRWGAVGGGLLALRSIMTPNLMWQPHAALAVQGQC